MPNWSVKISSAAVDPANNGNIIVTFTATNSATNETVVETAPSSNWTVEKEVAYRQNMRDKLVLKDTLRASATSFLPTIQSYIAGNPAAVTG